MKGYVMNSTNIYRHAMKRAIAPGGKVSLDELYEQYGKKHNIPEGVQFVEWLKNVKLADRSIWKIIYKEDSSEVEDNTVNEIATQKDDDILEENTKKIKPVPVKEQVSPILAKEMDVSDVVGLSVRKAREKLEKINDLNLLKYALQEARQIAGKDTLCILLRKRIEELESWR
jgi:hypothetical protein